MQPVIIIAILLLLFGTGYAVYTYVPKNQPNSTGYSVQQAVNANVSTGSYCGNNPACKNCENSGCTWISTGPYTGLCRC